MQGKLHTFQKSRAINNSDGIVAISENTKKDLLKFNPSFDENRVRVIYNGFSRDFYQLACNQSEHGKFVLFVGSRAKYKNFDLLVEAMRELPDFKLLVVGSKFSQAEESLLDECCAGRFELKSGVSNEDLNRLYNSAHAFVYPSLYEGFGIPVAEAMAAGCPVIALNCSSIPEVAGEAAILLDESNPMMISNAIRDLEQTEYRQNKIDLGLVQSRQFNWDRCYAEIKQFYQELIS